MAKKYSLKKPDPLKKRVKDNKRIAIRLLVSLVVFLSIYFGLVRTGFYYIQDIYIYTSFALAIIYAACALYIARLKQNKSEKELTGKEKELLTKLDNTRKHLIILFLPMLAAVVIDFVLLYYDVFGLADYFGI